MKLVKIKNTTCDVFNLRANRISYQICRTASGSIQTVIDTALICFLFSFNKMFALSWDELKCYFNYRCRCHLLEWWFLAGTGKWNHLPCWNSPDQTDSRMCQLRTRPHPRTQLHQTTQIHLCTNNWSLEYCIWSYTNL